MEMRRTKKRTQRRESLFSKMSLEIVDTIAECRLSKTARLSATTIITVNPMTHEGSSASTRKNARPPYVPRSQTTSDAVMKPVGLKRKRTTKITTAAIDTRMHNSLSV